jgi:hypothetical protein
MRSSGAPTSEHLDSAAAEQWVAAAHKRPSVPQEEGGSGSIWDSLGDFFSEVVDGLVSGVELLISSTAQGVVAVVNFVMDGVEYVWNAIVNAVDELVDLVEAVFTKVSVFFTDLLGWVGWVFNWSDILLTHQALVYIANNGIALASVGLQTIQANIDAGIAQLQGQITKAVNNYVAQLQPGETLGSSTSVAPTAPTGAAAFADPRNVFVRGVQQNADHGSSTPTTPYPSAATAPAGQLLQQIEPIPGTAMTSSGFEQLGNVISPLNGTSPYDAALSDVLPAVGNAAVSGLTLVQGVVDSVFTAAIGSIDGIQTMINAEWNIPLVTDLSAWITDGSPLTALDVSCLLLAVPVTVTYKVMFNESPVPDQATLEALEAAYPPPTMGAVLGAARGSSISGDTNDPGMVLYRIGALGQGFCYGLTGLIEPRLDLGIALWGTKTPTWPPALSEKNALWAAEPGAIWSQMYLFFEFLTSGYFGLTTCVQHPDVWNCSTADGGANLMWAVNNLVWISDAAALLLPAGPGKLVRAWNAGAGGFLISLFGAVQLIANAVIAYNAKSGKAGNLGSVFANVPQLTKLLISAGFNNAEGVPLGGIAAAGLDFVFNEAAAVSWIVAAALPPT